MNGSLRVKRGCPRFETIPSLWGEDWPQPLPCWNSKPWTAAPLTEGSTLRTAHVLCSRSQIQRESTWIGRGFAEAPVMSALCCALFRWSNCCLECVQVTTIICFVGSLLSLYAVQNGSLQVTLIPSPNQITSNNCVSMQCQDYLEETGSKYKCVYLLLKRLKKAKPHWLVVTAAHHVVKDMIRNRKHIVFV